MTIMYRCECGNYFNQPGDIKVCPQCRKDVCFKCRHPIFTLHCRKCGNAVTANKSDEMVKKLQALCIEVFGKQLSEQELIYVVHDIASHLT